MAFMLRKHLKFIDSFQFMSTSLDKLISNLPKDGLKYTSEEFTGDKLSLMSQKGVYPYDYMDCFEKFDQTELSTKKQFYSVLNSQHITNVEYDHARKVWGTFNLKIWVNTMTYTLRVICFCWLVCSKASERPVCNTIN